MFGRERSLFRGGPWAGVLSEPPQPGQVPNFPSDVIVECRAMATAEGMRPIMLPAFDSALAGTLATRGFSWSRQ